MKMKRKRDGVHCDVVGCKELAEVVTDIGDLCTEHNGVRLKEMQKKWEKEHPEEMARLKEMRKSTDRMVELHKEVKRDAKAKKSH